MIPSSSRSLLTRSDVIGLVAACLVLLGVWAVCSYLIGVPEYLLPSPASVVARAIQENARLALDFGVTGAEALAGFLISSVLSLILAVYMIMRADSDRYLMPMLVVIKSVPIVALAPLIGYWFGYGNSGKIFMASLISFFPLVVSAVAGMRSVSREQLDFFRVMDASRWEEVTKLRLPKAMPNIFSAMRIAAPLAVVGAIVAEMLGARAGLGYTIAVSSMTLDIPLNFAAMLLSGLLGIVAFYVILICERFVLRRLRLSTEPI